MFTKIAIALVLIAGTASGALAQSNKKHSNNPANDVFDTSGRYLGSDPDPSVRAMIQRDAGN
jgi:hypothetical protein